MNSLIRNYEVEVNTLFATMTEIQNTTIGNIIIQLNGEDSVIDQAAAFLEGEGVQIEEEELV